MPPVTRRWRQSRTWSPRRSGGFCDLKQGSSDFVCSEESRGPFPETGCPRAETWLRPGRCPLPFLPGPQHGGRGRVLSTVPPGH